MLVPRAGVDPTTKDLRGHESESQYLSLLYDILHIPWYPCRLCYRRGIRFLGLKKPVAIVLQLIREQR